MTSDEILFTILPTALADNDPPAAPSTDRVQIRIEGEDPLVMHMGFDEDGDLLLRPGALERPLLELVLGPGLPLLIRGGLRARLGQAPGWRRISRRVPACLHLTKRSAARLRQLRGVAEIELRGDLAERVTLRVVFGGDGPDRSCRVLVDAETAVALAAGLIDLRRWIELAASRIEGDSDLLHDVLATFFPAPATLTDYLFIWDRARGQFPLRLHVRAPEQAPVDEAMLHGSILNGQADEVMAVLRSSFSEPTYVVEQMSATSWQSVEENFPGLHEHW